MPKLKKHTSLAVADKVLSLLQKRCYFSEQMAEDLVIEVVSNCREQGYFIRSFLEYDWGVSFMEHRNSDNIVVYVGKHEPNGIPTDSAYYAAKFFQSRIEAVDFIYEALVDNNDRLIEKRAIPKVSEPSKQEVVFKVHGNVTKSNLND